MAKTLITSASIGGLTSYSITSGIDSTYDVYEFHIIGFQPQNATQELTFQMDNGSGYATSITSTVWRAWHDQNNTYAQIVNENSSYGQVAGTGYQEITDEVYANSGDTASGVLTIFNPSSTTEVKHFMSEISHIGQIGSTPNVSHVFCAGYFDTTSPLTRIDFKAPYLKLDSGWIHMYGVS